MVSINYSSREVCCKIVYYGPGLSGKTTNLQYVHAKVPGNTRGDMISLATEADRTLYFDFLPINIGAINGFAAKFQLYTVPGQVYYNATRKLVLRGVDGVVFVADSQPDKMDENIDSLMNLEENLREYGYDLNELPIVIQYNKRDLPGVLTVAELDAKLNSRNAPSFEASATIGNGVFDTLKKIIKMVLERAKGTSTPKAPKSAMAGVAQSSAVSSVSSTPQPTAEVSSPVADKTAFAETPPNVNGKEEATPFREPAVPPSEETPVESNTPPVPEAKPQTDTPVEEEAVEKESAKPAEHQNYRPYPGSISQKIDIRDKKFSASSFSPSRQDAASDAVLERKLVDDGEPEEKDARGRPIRPLMAPSLRRKNSRKKRGFFKRLFGIK